MNAVRIGWGAVKRDLRKAFLLLAMGGMAVAMPGWGQTATTPEAHAVYVPTLTFDVASVRESKPPAGVSFGVSGGFATHSSTLRLTNFNFQNLLNLAYGVRWDQIEGVSDWRTMFNIEAKSDSTADERLATLSKEEQLLEQQHMMQTLLADRFKLKTHWETREGLAYNLVLGKRGLKMQEAKGGPPSGDELKVWGDRPVPVLYQQGDSRVGFDLIAHGCSMDDIVRMLAGLLGHPVVDKTGLAGKYDFKLRYHGILLSERPADDLDPVSTLDTAIQDQLGLKVEPSKGPVQMLVVDHIEMPSEN
jgi:uncharacterized protein (TIGR03435 family)